MATPWVRVGGDDDIRRGPLAPTRIATWSRTDDGRTPVSEALRRNHPELAAYLRSKGGVGADVVGDVAQSPD